MLETKKCPYCGEQILAVARKCKHCGEWLDPETERKQEWSDDQAEEPCNASEESGGEAEPSRRISRKTWIYIGLAVVLLVLLIIFLLPGKSS